MHVAYSRGFQYYLLAVRASFGGCVVEFCFVIMEVTLCRCIRQRLELQRWCFLLSFTVLVVILRTIFLIWVLFFGFRLGFFAVTLLLLCSFHGGK